MDKTPLQIEIINLWHISKVCSIIRYDRMQYVKNALKEHFSDLIKGYTNKELWFEIEDQLNNQTKI